MIIQMIKNILFLLFSALVFSQEDGSAFDFLYPSENLIIKYHDDWGKGNYKKIIQEFKKDPLKYNEIVFLGNSITAEGKNWSERLNYPNIKNRGIGGDVTDGVLSRIMEIIYFKPKAVFLLIGINDIWNNDSPNIPSPQYIGNNIIKITQAIGWSSPDTKIYVQTILPIEKKKFKKSIVEVNKIIKSNDEEFEVIDLYSVFVNKNGLMTKELTTDGIHLNEKGYKKWVDFIKPIIYSINN
tara:strand:- start:35 stop:754 length:720 start_codon:yes stop_codon:yes gene_type:complete